MTSTTAAEVGTGRWRAARPLLVLGFWLGVWQAATAVVHQDILLVSPVAVLARLLELAPTGAFWATIGASVLRIVGGFVAATVVGCLLAALGTAVPVLGALVTPLLRAVRATPVVSFIILVLLWADSGRLAFVVSFLMVLPVVYTNVLEGIGHRDVALLEAAAVFRVPLLRRIGAVDAPAVLPYLVAACRTGVGLAWKSGVAAEVIGLPRGSIGEQLYLAKIFLSTADLFAWTAVVVAVSFVVERLVVATLGRVQARLAHGGAG